LNSACSRECILFVKGQYNDIILSQSLLLTNAIAVCCSNNSVYFLPQKWMPPSELMTNMELRQPMLLACKNPCKSGNAD
jgi:hypothetical protein